MSRLTRRDFLQAATVIATGAGLAQESSASAQTAANGNTAPVVIASGNGLPATEQAVSMLNGGADTLDAVIGGVNIVEEDPDDHSVGYGGLPNEEGVVELDSSVMHGPTCGAGAVAALRNIKTPSRVAKLVMERTDHVMLVGEGALRFARAHGFKEVNLLTDEARTIWLRWKETYSDVDDWLPPAGEPADDTLRSEAHSPIPFTYGTIHCCALDAKGDLSGVTTTSGLSYKIPGRVGDSPIIGAGLYVDNNVGAAGATGRGEAVIKVCGAYSIVEAMRQGMSPLEACLDALRKIVATTTAPRLKQSDGRPNFDVTFYALAKDGRFGSASMWSGSKFAVHANGQNRLEPSAYLYKRRDRA